MDLNIPDWIPVTLIGILIAGLIWWKLSDEIRLRFRGLHAEGTIINWMSATEKGVTYYYPLIEFNTQSGQKITYRADERSESKPLYPPGTKVKVRYLAHNPKMVRTTYP